MDYELHLDINLDELISGWLPQEDDAELELTELLRR